MTDKFSFLGPPFIIDSRSMTLANGSIVKFLSKEAELRGCHLCDIGNVAKKFTQSSAAVERFPNKPKPHWGFNQKPKGSRMQIVEFYD